MDFTAGLDPCLVNPPQPLVLAINPPIITSVLADGPIDEGSSSTIMVKARATHENPLHPTPFTYQFDVRDDGSYSLSSQTGVVSLTFDQPGTYVIPIRVVSQEGTFATTSATIQVLNVAPSLLSPGDQSAVEGTPATVNLGQFSDPGNDSPWTERINWGDGSPVQTLTYTKPGSLGSLVHTYELDGTYQVTLDVADSLGAATQGSFSINVTNVPPTIQGLTINSPVLPGQAANLLLDFSDPGSQDTFHVTVDWGDGRSSTAELGPGIRTYAASHDYGSGGGQFETTVTIIDHGGGQAFASSAVQVIGSPVPAPPPAASAPAAADITPLSFFNSPSPMNAPAKLVVVSPAIVSLPRSPGQAISHGKPASNEDSGPISDGGGRSLEDLLALLRATRRKLLRTGWDPRWRPSVNRP